MDPARAMAFAQRPWALIAALKEQHWACQFAERGWTATVSASQALWEHMRRVRPEWPSEEERREDLAHHLALKRALDRAAGAFRSVPAG